MGIFEIIWEMLPFKNRRTVSSDYTPNNSGAYVGGDLIVHGNFVNTVHAHPSTSHASAAEITPFRCNLPLSTPHFSGRTTIMKEILDNLTDESTQLSGGWRRMVALVGLGGMGKSETACQFAKEHKKTFPNVAWINAETEQSALDSFLSLAKYLEIVPHETQKADLDLVKRIYRHMDTHCYDNVLFIFDNAVQLNPHEIDFGIIDFLVTEDLANHPYFIITSQAPDWQKGITAIPLVELSEEDSLSFYRSSFKISSSECDESFKKLHSHLQGYPLAMNLAASNVDYESQKHSARWLEEKILRYIEKFENEDSSSLTQKINKNWPSKYNKTLSTVWQLCFKRVQEEPNGGNALILLQAISFFHVPVNTFHLKTVFIECHYCPGTPDWMKYDHLEESIRLLERFHIVACVFRTLNHSEPLKALQNNAENNSEDFSTKFEEEVKKAKSFWCELRVHRLVQRVVRLEDCSVVLEDILRYLAFWADVYCERQLNVAVVEEAFGRTSDSLSKRALAFVGLIALKGNPAARNIVETTRAPAGDPAATTWRVLQLDKKIETLNNEAIQVLRAFIGLSRSAQSLTDKRCFAEMAVDMFWKRRIFPFVRDDGTSAPGIFLQDFAEIEGIACELLSTACSLTDICSLPLLCSNPYRSNSASVTVAVGKEIIEDLTKANTPESRLAQITEVLSTYREFMDQGKDKWHTYFEEFEDIVGSDDSWKNLESEVESCGFDQMKLKQVFHLIFVRTWLASENKNFHDRERLAYTFITLDTVIYNFLETPRSREILIPLMDAFIEIDLLTAVEQMSLLKNLKSNTNNAAIWICSTWMKFCTQEGYDLSVKDLSTRLCRVQILHKMREMPTGRMRDILLLPFDGWKYLQEYRASTYDKFMQMYSESTVEEIKILVTFCKEIRNEMSVALKPFGYPS